MSDDTENKIEREIIAWVYTESKESKQMGLSKTQFKKGIRVAMKQLTKVAIKEADKF